MSKKSNCLYFHINPITCKIFYVGIGTTKRPFDKRARNPHWHNIVNKYGYVVDVISENLSWEEACILEKKYIVLLGRADESKGPLVNMTEGGDGQKSLSLETKLKMSLARTGRTASQETKLKMSMAAKGKPKSEEAKKNMREARLGKKHSEETKLKVGAASRGRNIGRIISEETRKKLKEARSKRTPCSEETRQKMRNSRLKFLDNSMGSKGR